VTDAPLRLAHAEALRAAGLDDEARTAIVSAHDRLLARADRCTDPALRAMYLEGTPCSARTLALAADWA